MCAFLPPPWRAAIVLSALGWIAGQAIHGQVVLNEFLAENRTAVANGSDFPDYIELANPSDQAVSLAGASLSDDPANPKRFVFPAGVTIPAGGYLVIWADTQVGAAGLHAGFALGVRGEQVRLYASDGTTLLDEVTFGLQLTDLSLGRFPDATGGWKLTRPTPGAPNEVEPAGSAAQLRINEWMARPSAGDDWLELFNAASLPVDLGGLVLTDSNSAPPLNRPIPAYSFIKSRGFVRLWASDLEQPDADHLDFRLGADGETLTLFHSDRSSVLDRVTFGAQTEDVAQGRAPDGSDNISFFALGAATPGEANVAEITEVVVSEILSHTDPPFEDAIELQNVGNTPVDVSHWWLSDSASTPQKFRIPPGTLIPAGGFVVFYEHQFSAGATGFSLDSADGDQVYLSAGDASGRLTGRQTFVRFGALRNGVSAGRFQTSVGIDFVPLERPTFGVDNPSSLEQFRSGKGATNAPSRIGPVVITEIMSNLEQGSADLAFVELHNPTGDAVPLYDVAFPTSTWQLADGIRFEFPFQVTMPPAGYLLVVSFDPAQNPEALAAFRSQWAVPATVPILGPFEGRLSSVGEALELLRPDAPEGPDDPNAGFVPYELVERIDYALTPPWPPLAQTLGHSLQRRSTASYGNEPLNWIGALPTPGHGGDGTGDRDGDGMPDAWEEGHGLAPDSALDATLDPDTDGLNNLQEFLAGTDPRDAASVVRISSIQRGDGQLRLTFAAVRGKAYHLQAGELLSGGRWLTVASLEPAPLTGPRELVIPAPAAPATWYRLLIPTNQ